MAAGLGSSPPRWHLGAHNYWSGGTQICMTSEYQRALRRYVVLRDPEAFRFLVEMFQGLVYHLPAGGARWRHRSKDLSRPRPARRADPR